SGPPSTLSAPRPHDETQTHSRSLSRSAATRRNATATFHVNRPHEGVRFDSLRSLNDRHRLPDIERGAQRRDEMSSTAQRTVSRETPHDGVRFDSLRLLNDREAHPLIE